MIRSYAAAAVDPTLPPDAATTATTATTAASAASPSLLHAAVDTWLRYVVPLTLLSAIALSPVIVLALRVRVPVDQPGANAILAAGWELLAVAWLGQLVLVGAAAAIIRTQPSQPRALGDGLIALGRAIIPCLAAALAIALGSLALVVPGLVLVVLLALTGASRAPGASPLAALADSIAATRRQLPAVAVTVVALLALDIAIVLVAQHVLVALFSHPPTPIQLRALRSFVRAIALALVVVSPLPATVLALLRTRA
jgi:hypothetical protein